MAIQRGPFGNGFVKRLGSTVGYKLGGGRYGISAYQPEVRNPQSLLQRVQRAKFLFLRTLAKQFTNAGLIGLEREPYAQLAQAFMSLNMPKVIMITSPSVVQVDVYETCPDIILSSGYEVSPLIVATTLDRGQLTFSVMTSKTGSENKPDGVIVVVAVDKMMGVPGYEVQLYDYGYDQQDNRRWYTSEKRVTCIWPGADVTTNAFSAYIWAYNYRYVGGKLKVGASTWGSASLLGGAAISMSSPAGVVGAYRRYSPTAFAEIANNLN